MGFYKQRSGEEYYGLVRGILGALGPRQSILDVGCWDSPVATWGMFNERYSVDIRRRPELPKVVAVEADWMEVYRMFRCGGGVDTVVCLQTLEHVPEPATFAMGLFHAANANVIISVPWCWPPDTCVHHIHDPVDATKLRSWTHRTPYILNVTGGKSPRAVAVYAANPTA